MYKQARIWFIVLHVVLVLLLCLFPVYQTVMQAFPVEQTECFLHKSYHLYCWTCGGTRAVNALLHLDLLGALRYNALVTVSAVLALVLDVVAWVRFFQKKLPFYLPHLSIWIAWLALWFLYPIARNALMILFGFDPTGDLGDFWNNYMGRQ